MEIRLGLIKWMSGRRRFWSLIEIHSLVRATAGGGRGTGIGVRRRMRIVSHGVGGGGSPAI